MYVIRLINDEPAAMATTDIDFIWHRARDYGLDLSKRGQVIRQKGRLEPYSPLRMENLPFQFAKLDGSPEGCLEFAKHFGFLETVPGQGDEELIADWRHSIAYVRGWVELLAGRLVPDPQGQLRTAVFAGRAPITKVDVLISVDAPGSQRMVLRPPTLLSAMLLQLAQSSAIATCRQCGMWFEVGADGKRSIAKFCSDRCRNRFNYERRAKK